MPTHISYSAPAVAWPYPDRRPRRFLKREPLALVAISLITVATVLAALILATNETRTTSGLPIPADAAPAGPLTEAPPAEQTPRRQSADLDRSTYESLSAREFALMAKNPNEWTGRKVVIYGVVTQFDPATGPSAFRANTAAAPQADPYDYEQNTVIAAQNPQIVADIVEDDVVTMYVKVGGSYTYPTQIGGSTTAPMM